jgi:hypothetical protein
MKTTSARRQEHRATASKERAKPFQTTKATSARRQGHSKERARWDKTKGPIKKCKRLGTDQKMQALAQNNTIGALP